MKMWISRLIRGLWAAAVLASVGAEADPPQRVLFLGNSVWDYQGGVHQPFLGFCKAAGLDFEVTSQMRQRENAHGIEFLDWGRIPLSLSEVAANEEILSIIRTGGYDFVVLEGRRSGYLMPERVGLPEDRGASLPFEQNLAALGTLHRTIVESGARTAFYMHPGLHTLDEIKLPLAQVYLNLHAGLEAMEIGGQRHDVLLVPASFLWRDAIKRFGVEGWYADRGHGNALARYASGCLLYAFLTERDPRQNPFRDLPRTWDVDESVPVGQVSLEDAEWIKRQVWLYYTTRVSRTTE